MTDYVAWEDERNTLSTDSKQNLEMDLTPVEGKCWLDEEGSMHYSSGPLTEDQLVTIGVGILGPLFYFTDNEEMLIEKIKAEFAKRGFTFDSSWEHSDG